MKIRLGNGASGAVREESKASSPILATASENPGQLLRGNDLQLGIGAIGGLFVGTPSAELRRMPEAISLHVVVGHFDNQFGA